MESFLSILILIALLAAVVFGLPHCEARYQERLACNHDGGTIVYRDGTPVCVIPQPADEDHHP